jgi:hypothetical protein
LFPIVNPLFITKSVFGFHTIFYIRYLYFTPLLSGLITRGPPEEADKRGISDGGAVAVYKSGIEFFKRNVVFIIWII